MFKNIIPILFCFVTVNLHCQWKVEFDDKQRPISATYWLTELTDTVNLGRERIWGSCRFNFKGYDKGHLVPYAHFDYSKENAKEISQCKLMVPQTKILNRYLIKGIETYERKLVELHGCLIVKIEVDYKERISFKRKIWLCDYPEEPIGEFNYSNDF